ncbi:hypothetical protein SLEP1_g47410 [Rubroshorea leprosula]|uniref:Cytochrome P450 n=1 Tax=Rubroshorea leprosula TaxID=152421 RepID=A0AAV5LT64_9ROSI|nr:hypothetical protein SLEP1_g47410 [Rubroshorea leprosula]
MMSSCGGESPTPTTYSFLSFLSHPWISAGCNSEEASRFMWNYAAWELNAFLWISLIGITSLLTQKLFKFFKLWIQARRIPGPPCSSFYGHCGLAYGERLIDLLSDSHKQYGSVVKLWLGPTQLLVSIKDPDLIKEILLKAKDKLPLTRKAFRLAFGLSTFFVSSFDKVQKRRDSLTNELNGRLLGGANILSTKATDCVMEKVQQMVSRGSIDSKLVSQHMAFTLLGATLFGDAFLDWSKAALYEQLLMKIAKDACFWASYNVTPFWKQGFWRYQHLCIKLKSLTQDIVQQCRTNYKLFCCMNPSSNNQTANVRMETVFGAPSFSGVVVQDNHSMQELNDHLNARDEPCGNLMGVMFHGCLTTAGLISNMLERLARHPEIQDKIHLEIIMAQICSVKGDQHNVDLMPLLLATVYESARLLSAAPLLQRCSLEHDLRLKSGVIIPAGTVLVVPVQLVHRDNSSWGNEAGKFNPYRFLSKAGKIPDLVHHEGAEELLDHGQSSFVLNHPDENPVFLSFGSGTRACVGQKFVMHAVATLFASLLEQYEVRLQPGSKDPSTIMKNSSVFQKIPSQEIAFVRRNT